MTAIVRRTKRTNKGINTQLLLDSQTDERLEKDAKGLLWLFYLKGDPNAFPIEYNCSRWPKKYSLAMKMGLKPGDKVNLDIEGVPVLCSLTCRIAKSQVFFAERAVAEKVAQADHSLTDISYLP